MVRGDLAVTEPRRQKENEGHSYAAHVRLTICEQKLWAFGHCVYTVPSGRVPSAFRSGPHPVPDGVGDRVRVWLLCELCRS